MKIISWNVNGLNAILKKDFSRDIALLEPDVLCLQETRVSNEIGLDHLGFAYHQYSYAEKKGYSGTAIFSKEKPKAARIICPCEPEPTEGRCVTFEYEQFFLVNVYVPNSGSELKRLWFRSHEWDPGFRQYLCELEKKKPVIACGDFNVAHQEIDLANPESNHFSAGFTDEERAGFSLLLQSGFEDIFRKLNPDKPKCYTWWSYRTAARKRNVGWRIDYFLTSPKLRPHIKDAYICQKIEGSDHAPVALEIEFCYSK
ncbi:MAG: exodeoxyribonuclease III [Verrucomicrobia bacterium GWC2_42_7]|nr:MAG: exodeoxyribonuclease III [Verrucomicrobia bacterium GWC2_42_7]